MRMTAPVSVRLHLQHLDLKPLSQQPQQIELLINLLPLVQVVLQAFITQLAVQFAV